jgi:arylsulfatase A-like enzyme
VHVPGTAPGRIETPVMVADVTPTILGALGLPPDPRMQGVDLSKGRAPERSVWSEVTHKTHQYALRDPAGWKMIFAPREGRATPLFEKEEEWELFRLNADPRERRALDEERPDEAERMRAAIRALRRRLEAYGQSLGSIDLVPLGADDVRDLRKLGYM